MIGKAVEDYVKTIYSLAVDNERVTPSLVAEHLGVSLPAVTKMVKRLQELKLARYERAKGLRLTPAGEKIALEVIRHHRLLELYLEQALGYSWDEVHDEAERLEHVISENFEDKIEKLLGYPKHDPHGAPIPDRNGHMDIRDATVLAKLAPGDRGTIERVSDHDQGMLAYLGELGMYPGTPIEMVAREPFGGSLSIRVSGRQCSVGRELARNVFVSLEEDDE